MRWWNDRTRLQVTVSIALWCITILAVASEAPVAHRSNMQSWPFQESFFSAPIDVTIAATRTAIEQAGYVVHLEDVDAGLLIARTPVSPIDRMLLPPIRSSARATARFEAVANTGTVVYIDFVERTETPHRHYEGGMHVVEEGIRHPETYEKIFAEARRAVGPATIQ